MLSRRKRPKNLIRSISNEVQAAILTTHRRSKAVTAWLEHSLSFNLKKSSQTIALPDIAKI